MSGKVNTFKAPASRLAGEPCRIAPIESGRALRGLLIRRECWILSGRAKLLLLGVSICAVWIMIRSVHPFLAVTHRTPSSFLVVEGWIPSYAVNEAIIEFRTGGYRGVLTCGGPTHEDSGKRVGSTYA